MKISTDFNLKNNNSFGLDICCDTFVDYDDNATFCDFLSTHNELLQQRFLILGNGCNTLFTNDFHGTILHSSAKNIDILETSASHTLCLAEAGVVWDDFVAWTIQHGLHGLENLSAIPSSVGACAVQNIGAYGSEACNCIHRVNYLNINTLRIESLAANDCRFAYRDSIFKHELKDKALILSVVFKLRNTFEPNLSYADLKSYFAGAQHIDAQAVRDAVTVIRARKLPDPQKIGNAGSFFKNPVVTHEQLRRLQSQFPDLRYFSTAAPDVYKLAAGWMIDKCGLKSFRHKGAAVHENQALVLINAGNAAPSDIVELAEIIQSKVMATFGIPLAPEVIYV